MKTYPIHIEISKGAKPFKIDRNDPNFDRPLKELFKDYETIKK